MRVWSLFWCLYVTLSLSLCHVTATIPTIDFTGLLTKYATTTDSWCTTCAAFSTQCAMGCAGDGGGGGPCPADACPRVFTFSTINSSPVWNIKVATNSNPYRAFSYIPLCTQSSQCTEPFVFSFSLYYTPAEGSATSHFFGKQEDYLKLLFWGDGNNILGVKNGQLLGAPNGGGGDLVGSTTTGSNNAFSTPFVSNSWMHVAVQLTYSNNRAALAFWVNGAAIGSTGSIGTSNSGLQFGAYVWGGTFFTLQYKDIAITSAGQIPSPSPSPATTTATTTVTPTTAAPTNTPGSGSSSSTGKNNAGTHHIRNGASVIILLTLLLIVTLL